MKSLKNILIIAVIIIILLAVKFIFFPGKKPVAPDMKKMAAAPVLVDIFVAREKPVSEKLSVTGNILANEQVDLKPEIAGKVTSISFTEGGDVSTGQILVKLTDADLRAQLAKLDHQRKLAVVNEKRYSELLKVQGVSVEEYESVLNQVNILEAEMDIVREQIRKSSIQAPFNGTIGLKTISTGDIVTPSTIIATLQQLDPVRIEFSVPEKYAQAVKKAGAIRFMTDNSSDTLSAKIYAIEPRVDPQTRSVIIRARTGNKEKKILPGSFARVFLSLDEERGIMIPTEAVIPEQKGKKVFVARNGKSVSVPVETGFRTEDRVQILSGINSGDSVIITGLMQVRPEGNVKINSVKAGK